MSSYSQKKHRAMCAWSQDCEEPGTVLTTIRGTPEWLCPQHFKVVRRENDR